MVNRIKPTAQADQRSNDTALLIMHEHGRTTSRHAIGRVK
jgi:hypothetical protein